MVVKSIKKFVELSSSTVINNNLEDYLEIGVLYQVYGVRIFEGITYYMIFFEERHLVEVPSELFEIIDAKVSPLWEIYIENGSTTFWPVLFYQDNFFENFSEWEDLERQEFSNLRKLFEE